MTRGSLNGTALQCEYHLFIPVFALPTGFPRYKGGPMFWAEHELGLAAVYTGLKALSEQHPDQPGFIPSDLLVQVVESGATLKEELYFRNQGAK